MDLRKLKTLIDLVAESGIAELEVTEGDGKVRIVKSAAQIAGQAVPVPMPMPAAPLAPETPVAAPQATAPAPEPLGQIVKSPMVGTFYRSPAPGKAPFVELGQAVKAAEPVCIIEAMKLLNEIEAGFDGVIKEILAENGQPVEFGQPLFVIG
ncbi:MAG: acetyl-CoA carboxylase biotin carboxyl carrier protein [Burkholderiaceae bacterium]|jgi:acetyl-CoA carboxylase biotin carboxyl carrier protein